jgi:DNA-binding transcriptional ArsR family regulator
MLKGRDAMATDAMAAEGELSRAELVEALKALANPARLQILEWLRDPEGEFADYDPIADRAEVGVCASHIQARAGLSQSTISSYMGVLERAGLVTSTRIGKWTHYRRNEALLARIADALVSRDTVRT